MTARLPVGDGEAKFRDALLSRLRLKDLRFLLSISSNRSLTAAADEFGLTQPAASRWLKDIEQMFRAHLFDRDRMVGMTTTALGALVVARARALVSDVDALSSAVESLRSGTGGHLRLGVIPFVSTLLMERLVSHLVGDKYRMTVSITEGATEPLLEALRMERVDAVIGRSSNEPISTDLSQEVLFNQQGCLIVNPENPILAHSDVKLMHLGNCRWLLPPKGSPTRAAINAAFVAAKLLPPRAQVETSSTRLIHALVSTKPDMIGVAPAEIGADLERLGGIRSLRFPATFKMPPVSLVFHLRHCESPQIQHLRQTLREIIAARHSWA